MKATRKSGRLLAATVAATAAGAALPAPALVGASGVQDALTRATAIRAEVDARYRQLPGRKLAVTESTATGIVGSLTLFTDWLEPPSVVPADDGIYFAVCSAGAVCPYPARSAAWPARAFLPRRQAVELALRTFVETSATLVVVALPTREPTWVVFTRRDLLADVDAPSILAQLAADPGIADASLRTLVLQITSPRLFLPIPILPPPQQTIYAVRLSGP